ncbi:MAG: hypothetical protein AAF624_07855 [Bacteroidota bacterium]
MRPAVLVSLLLGLASGCAPSISPLYRDFAPPQALDARASVGSEAASSSETAAGATAAGATAAGAGLPDEAELVDLASRALQRAEWTLASTPYDASTLRTEARTINNLGLYRTEVTLEVVPLRGGFVRVHVHPYRHYLVGGRSKLPYLNPGLRRAVLPALEDAFEAEGLRMLGTARKRDRIDT